VKEQKWVERFAARLAALEYPATPQAMQALGRALFPHWNHELPDEVAEWTRDGRLPNDGPGSLPNELS
jgi:hypothetical protein